MILSIIVGFGIGLIIGSIIDICIDVYDEYLTSSKAKKLAQEKTNQEIRKLVVENIKKDSVMGETIDVKAFDENNNHVANITYNATQGSSLCANYTY